MVVEHIDPAQHAHEQAPTTPAVWSLVSCRPEWASSNDKCREAALRDDTAFVVMDLRFDILFSFVMTISTHTHRNIRTQGGKGYQTLDP